jgi:tetratricopeptide (TPR) repeat protein
MARARRRALAAGCALAVLAAAGALVAGWPAPAGPGAASAPIDMGSLEARRLHARQQREQEIASRFARGVALLNARQYQEAASEWHRVLELAPQLPEAHVNMGFTMIGLQRHAIARDFFGVAIDLNKQQLNAYFGLAVALDGLGDRAGALGAMRSYVHLSKGEDRYRPKAQAAIRAWEAELAATRAGAAVQAGGGPIPETGNGRLSPPIGEKSIR